MDNSSTCTVASLRLVLMFCQEWFGHGLVESFWKFEKFWLKEKGFSFFSKYVQQSPLQSVISAVMPSVRPVSKLQSQLGVQSIKG